MGNVGTTRMSQIYDEAHIRTGVVAADKNTLFRYLADTLGRLEDLDPDMLYAGLRARETMMSTLIGPGIALPHTRIPGFGRSTGMLAVVPAGCEYGDGGVIKIALMIADDEDESGEHLGILRQFALMARNPRFAEKVLGAANAAEVQTLISRLEKTL